jgi:hypothetical protein
MFIHLFDWPEVLLTQCVRDSSVHRLQWHGTASPNQELADK